MCTTGHLFSEFRRATAAVVCSILLEEALRTVIPEIFERMCAKEVYASDSMLAQTFKRWAAVSSDLYLTTLSIQRVCRGQLCKDLTVYDNEGSLRKLPTQFELLSQHSTVKR